MKWNWGTAIFLFFIIYISILVFFVFKSRTIDHSLVMDNYYEHDIQYQNTYNKIEKQMALQHDVAIRYQTQRDELILDFGKKSLFHRGVVHFYRPSNASLDYNEHFDHKNDSISVFNAQKLIDGKWIVKIDWTDESGAYYKEVPIKIKRP